MNPFERLREIAHAFRQGGQEERRWFDGTNPMCSRGEKLLKGGQAEEAERIFASVLSESRYSGVVKKQHPRVLLALAAAQVKQEKWEQAGKNAAAARVLLNGARAQASAEYADCCQLQGEIAQGLGDAGEALDHFKEGVEAVKAQRQPDWSEAVRRMTAVARLLRESGKHEEAEQTAREAVETSGQQRPGEKEEADALIEWAACLAECGKFDEAREVGETAVDRHRAACGGDAAEVAQDYEKLAGICQKQGDYQAAVGHLERALQARERQIGGDTSQLALLLITLADIYGLLGRLAPALELMQQAVGKLGPSRDGNLAGALEKLGTMYVHTGRYEDAADCYRRARDYWVSEPETYSAQLSANSKALESLSEWLPAEEPGEGAEEADDSGISVLMPDRPAASEAAAALVAGEEVKGASSRCAPLNAGPQPGLQAMGAAAAAERGAVAPAGRGAAQGRGATGGAAGETDRNGLCGWEDLALEPLKRE